MQRKKNLLCLLCFLLAIVVFPLPLKSQVTIGSLEPPNANALLDLKETSSGTSTHGLLLPRVALQSTISPAPMTSHEPGMCVYNTSSTNDVTPGVYYNNGTRWIRMVPAVNYFYMPSILLPLDPSDPAYNASTQTFTVDLYAQYAAQYNLTSSTTSTKNPSATTLPVYANNALDYFITYYDNAVFTNVAVSDVGVLTYRLVATPVVSEKTYMNIVLQVKQ